jgi:hypothetical protein
MILLLGVVAASLGCLGGPKRVLPPYIDAKAAGLKAIEMYDTNKDGFLSGKELDQCPGLKAACISSGRVPPTVDPARTGRITAEMITERIRAWQATKIGRRMIQCTVYYNGQPLEGADVNFVPESFLGPNMKTASGVTDRNGIAMLTIPLEGERPLPGVPPGFYRVEITKPAKPAKPGKPGEPAEPARPGLNIPAKYNTETILGHEVAMDAADMRTGIKFNLVF